VQSGAVGALGELLRHWAYDTETLTAGVSGVLVGLVCNLVNNLPAGLVAGTAVHAANVPGSAQSSLRGIPLRQAVGQVLAVGVT
jgi:arsenical pump membrane protein